MNKRLSKTLVLVIVVLFFNVSISTVFNAMDIPSNSIQKTESLSLQDDVFDREYDKGIFPKQLYITQNGCIQVIKESNKNDFYDDVQKDEWLKLSPFEISLDDGNHPPIYINGNENFTTGNGVASGSGTPETPYIIENWIIIGNESTENGIFICNTDAYFVIRNCTISSFNNSGIRIDNVSYAKIEETEQSHNSVGIYIIDSIHIEIANCTCCQNLDFGIICRQSSYIMIISCQSYNNYNSGIFLVRSSYCTIDNTSCYNHGFFGIRFFTDKKEFPIEHNIIKNCKTYSNLVNGIFMQVLNKSGRHAGYNQIIGCEIYDNGHEPGIDNAFEGITILWVNNNIIEDCTIHHNGIGVYIAGSSNNIVRNCTIYAQWMHLFEGQGVQINGDTLSLDMPRHNIIEHCDIYAQGVGILICDSGQIYIRKNNILNNSWEGVIVQSFFGFNTVWINYNNICNNGYLMNNSGFGLYVFHFGFIDARNNWWNSKLGPSRLLLPIRGDKIFIYFALVLYRPWAKEPILDAGKQ